MIQITLKWKPISTQNAYLQRGKIRFMRKEAKQTKESYIWQVKSQYKWPVLEIPLQIEIKLYFWDKRIRDWDNWHKISMDALTGIIYKDDSQIKKATIEIMEIDKLNPRIELTII